MRPDWTVVAAIASLVSAIAATVGAVFAYKSVLPTAKKIRIDLDQVRSSEATEQVIEFSLVNTGKVIAYDVFAVIEAPETWQLLRAPARHTAGGVFFSNVQFDNQAIVYATERLMTGTRQPIVVAARAPAGRYELPWKVWGRNVKQRRGSIVVEIPGP